MFLALFMLLLLTCRYIWFMSDICHLMKTTRNCWEDSSKNGTRRLEVWVILFAVTIITIRLMKGTYYGVT